MEKNFKLQLEEKEIEIKTGKLAQLSNGSVVVSCGGTTVLVTASFNKEAREGINFLPLSVSYQEKFYAAGMIKSSRFQKRETRPADDKILMGRVIDRTIRPLFPKFIRNDIQVMVTTLSYDRENEHDVLAAIGSSAAIAVSEIPWNGPTATVRVGMINDKFILNPSPQERDQSDLDLIVSSGEENVVMIEAGAKEVSEDKILQAIDFGKNWGQKIAKFISQIAAEIGKPKLEIIKPEKDLEIVKFLT